MVILDAFLLEIVALLAGKLVGFAAHFGALRLALMINQERLAVVRALAIRDGRRLHLEDAEVDPSWSFSRPSRPVILRTLMAPGSWPIPEQRIEIKTHLVNNVRNAGLCCQ